MERAGGSEDHVACATYEINPIVYCHAAAGVAINRPDPDHVAIRHHQVAVEGKFVHIGDLGENFNYHRDDSGVIAQVCSSRQNDLG